MRESATLIGNLTRLHLLYGEKRANLILKLCVEPGIMVCPQTFFGEIKCSARDGGYYQHHRKEQLGAKA